MGYEFTQLDTSFYMKSESFEAAIDAMMLYDKSTNPVTEYPAGVPVYLAKTVKEKTYESFKFWGWEASFNDNGDIDYLEFSGINLHDEDGLFQAIEQYVENGSYIEAVGEDNSIWKWSWDNKKFKKSKGTVVYEYK